MTKQLQFVLALVLLFIAQVSQSQEFTIAQNVTGNNRSDLRGQVFSPSQQEDGTGTITSSGAVYLTSFNIIYDAGTEAETMYIYSTLPSTTASLDDGSGGVLVGQSTSKAEGEFPYTNYSFEYLELDINTTYYAVFRQDVQLEFGGSGSEEGPYAGGKMLKNDGTNILENDFAALKFEGEFSESIPPHQGDVDALIALYNSTDGDNWMNSWDLNGDPYGWHGLTWEEGRLMQLAIFSNNNMSGSLPSEISSLSELRGLRIEGNKNLSGIIPETIGSLTKLEGIYFRDTDINGLPESIEDLNNLTYLQITNSSLNNLPTSLYNLINLQELDLGGNHLTEIPTTLDNLSNLTSLSLAGNPFNPSALPANIGSLINLERLDVRNCNLTEIPTEISNLNSLVSLKISDNNLSGEIPSAIWAISNLQYLSIGNNNFASAPFPVEVVNLTKLNSFNFSNTNLTGSVPNEIIQLKELSGIFIRNNNLEGEILSTLSKMNTLYVIDIAGNNFTEEIPIDLENLTNMESLNISGNNFLGDFPDGITSNPNLYELRLNGNRIKSIPDFSKSLSLRRLYVHDNMLEFGDLEKNIVNDDLDFVYFPQGDIDVTTNLYISSVGEQVILNIDISGTGNSYQWFKLNESGSINGEAVSELSNSPLFIIPSVSDDDLGKYYCKISSTIVTDLELRTQTIAVTLATEFVNNPSITTQNALSLELEATINKNGTLYYLALPDGNIAPSEAQIIAGMNAGNEIVNNAANIVIEKDVAVQISIADLAPSTSYDLYFVAVDDELISQSMTSISGATIAGIQFIGDYPDLLSIDATNVIITANTTRAGSIYYVALPELSASPLVEQVLSGTNANGQTTTKGSSDINAETVTEITISGLDENNPYDIYLVAQDEEDLTSEIVKLAVQTITGIENPFKPEELTIYPNPVNNSLMIEFNLVDQYDISILTMNGQEVLGKSGLRHQTSVDVSDLDQGMYILKIQTQDRTGWMRFVKE